MTTRLLKVLYIFFLLASITSCVKPTYPKGKVVESIISLCKKEYNLQNVKVKIVGSTLGVLLPIEGLVDPDLKLNQKAGDKIEDVALAIHRVTMSTDRPLKFYILTARDTKTRGAEFVLTGFIYDVVRVRLLDISRGEYHKRILRDFRFNPVVAGELKIKELFKALNEHSPLTQNIRHLFYPIYVIGKKDSQKIEITDIDFKEISEQEALFFVKTKEYYDPLPGFEVYRAIFPSGFTNEYLILVNMSMFPNPIKEIVPKYFSSDMEIRQRNLRGTFDQYKDIGYLGLDGLPKKELTLDWFLSQQIARRIKTLFVEDKHLKERYKVETSHGSIEDKVFRFKFSISPHRKNHGDNEIIFSKILRLAATVLHRYSFNDFKGVQLTDTDPGGKKLYLSKDRLEKFRQKRIKIQDILS